jgi:hypothetical protein
VVDGSLVDTGSNYVFVRSGATLAGTGRVGAVQLMGGTLDPGSPWGYGTLHTGWVSLDSSSKCVVQLGHVKQ